MKKPSRVFTTEEGKGRLNHFKPFFLPFTLFEHKQINKFS